MAVVWRMAERGRGRLLGRFALYRVRRRQAELHRGWHELSLQEVAAELVAIGRELVGVAPLLVPGCSRGPDGLGGSGMAPSPRRVPLSFAEPVGTRAGEQPTSNLLFAVRAADPGHCGFTPCTKPLVRRRQRLAESLRIPCLTNPHDIPRVARDLLASPFRGRVPTLHEHAESVIDRLVPKGYILKFESLPHSRQEPAGKRVVITGGAGFIGSHFVRLVRERHPDWLVVNLDLLTYAADLDNLAAVLAQGVEHGPEPSGPNAKRGEVAYGERLVGQDAGHVLVLGDVADEELVRRLFDEFRFDFASWSGRPLKASRCRCTGMGSKDGSGCTWKITVRRFCGCWRKGGRGRSTTLAAAGRCPTWRS